MNKLAFVWLLMRSNIKFVMFHLILLTMCPLELIVVKLLTCLFYSGAFDALFEKMYIYNFLLLCKYM